MIGSACAAQVVLNAPPRLSNAKTGSAVRDDISNLTVTAREDYLYTEFTHGNIPDFLRTLKPVTVSHTVNSQLHTATFYVTPDYLAVGSDADFFRMPMTPILAQWLADYFSCSLPTRKMVDETWSAAAFHLNPEPIAPSPQMITVPVFYQHHQMVETQRVQAGAPLGALIAGIKKDVVITPQLPTRPPPPRVAIYGWHYPDGVAIQPLSLVHENTYADYSHGIRMVSNNMVLDGNSTTVQAVLADPNMSILLSDEGAVTTPRYSVSAPPTTFPYDDTFPQAGRELGSWTDRFTVPAVVSFSPTGPGGDGYVLRVRDPGGGIDSTRTGRISDADYYVEALIYCSFRPELMSDGFERVGIFARDDGNGMFEGISGGGVHANSYALTWDSRDGRVQCLRTIDGVAADLLPTTVVMPSTAWRKMRIEAVGSDLSFKVDDNVILNTTDTAHAEGQFGIGYHEYFTTNSNILGTYAENFHADLLSSSTVRDWSLY
jgi:hypothetical protein